MLIVPERPDHPLGSGGRWLAIAVIALVVFYLAGSAGLIQKL